MGGCYPEGVDLSGGTRGRRPAASPIFLDPGFLAAFATSRSRRPACDLGMWKKDCVSRGSRMGQLSLVESVTFPERGDRSLLLRPR